MASGHAQVRGISDAIAENAASDANDNMAAISQRDGRHSRRQPTDAFDQRGDLRIFWSVVAHEPAPELIVLAIEQL